MVQAPIMNSKPAVLHLRKVTDDALRRLVNLGGQVLSLVVTDVIRSLYPNISFSHSSKLRDCLKCDVTLANIAALYWLPQRLLFPISQVEEVRRSLHARAEVFKAYVGGLDKELAKNTTTYAMNTSSGSVNFVSAATSHRVDSNDADLTRRY
ncbi:hypothetical protein BGW80DRAFT_519045 [Lactifluus volemus]|nr:hypothetical protein BGW80DRAFT_519045 [Lactifluus volemus]